MSWINSSAGSPRRFLDLLAIPSFSLTLVWLGALSAAAAGPIVYPGQPSLTLIVLIFCGLSLFSFAEFAGNRLSRLWPPHELSNVVSASALRLGIVISSTLGLFGIALIVFERSYLSGIDNANYAGLLRCAPDLVGEISVVRTPLIYLGYLAFSFGFSSIALFLLRGEELNGWVAAIAQLSILSPIGYALTYSGRMSILIIIVLIVSIGIVRARQGRSFLLRGHYLSIKLLVGIVAFVAYTNATWVSRRDFCEKLTPLISELRTQIASNAAAPERDLHARSAMIDPSALGRKMSEMLAARSSGDNVKTLTPMEAQILVMEEAWKVRPSRWLLTAVDHEYISPSGAFSLIHNSFYFTQSAMVIERIWQSRQSLSNHLGVYQIGVLSPLIRKFFPESTTLTSMKIQLLDADIYGFFPGAWGAAIVDFGVVGGVGYILVWGLIAGWSLGASLRTNWATPPLLLTFVLTSVALSPIQGPLGLANSALLLVSLAALGVAVDWQSARQRARKLLLAPASNNHSLD
jgi:hypothetical protein